MAARSRFARYININTPYKASVTAFWLVNLNELNACNTAADCYPFIPIDPLSTFSPHLSTSLCLLLPLGNTKSTMQWPRTLKAKGPSG